VRHFRDEPKGKAEGFAEWAIIVGVALLAAFLIRGFVVQTFYIPSESMLPTLEVNDRVLVNKLSYRFGDIERGDIIVFERPPNDPDTTIEDLIKRVVALPGDTVESRNNELYVNGERVDEPYLDAGTPTDNLPRTQIDEGTVFVMGDNRTDSFDSRRLGAIDQDLIVGEAIVRIWPLSRMGTF
jgi:signal peptidase I